MISKFKFRDFDIGIYVYRSHDFDIEVWHCVPIYPGPTGGFTRAVTAVPGPGAPPPRGGRRPPAAAARH